MANAEVVASNIRGMSEELAKMTEAVERVKKELGATWQGPAAQAAQASTSETVQAAGRTQTLSDNGAERILDLGRSYEWLRRQVSFDDPAKYSGIQHIGDKLSEHLDHTNTLWHEVWQGGEDHVTVAERNKQLDAQATAALYQHQRHAQETDSGFALPTPDAPGGPHGNGAPGPGTALPHVSRAAGGLDAMPAGAAVAPSAGSGSGVPAAGSALTGGPVGMAPGVGSAVPSGTAGGSPRSGAPPGGPTANGAGSRGAGGPGMGNGPGAGGRPGAGGGPGAVGGPSLGGGPGLGSGSGAGGRPDTGSGPGRGRPPMTTAPSGVGPQGAGPGRTGLGGLPSWGGTGAEPSPAEAAHRQAELGRRFGQNLDSARLFPTPSPGPGRSTGWTGSGHSGWNSGTSRAPSTGGGDGRWGGGEPGSRGWGGRGPLEPAPGRGEPGSGRAGFTEPAGSGRASSSPAGGGPGPMTGGAGAGRGGEEHRNRYKVYSSQSYFEPDLPCADAVIQPCDEDEY